MRMRDNSVISKANPGPCRKGSICSLFVLSILPLVFLFPDPASAQAQDDTSTYCDYVNFPAPIERWTFRPLVGLSLTILPQILVEDELRQTPLLRGSVRYGLPLNFSLTGTLSTNVITNLIEAEARWDVQLNRFAFGLSHRIGWWYGFSPIEGFDITASSWVHFPGVSAGVRIRDFYLSARVEAQLVTSLEIQTDGIQTNSDEDFVAGYAFGLNLEQPFWGETDVALGLRFNYSRSLYQAWLAFNSFNEPLIYPEFTAGFLF